MTEITDKPGNILRLTRDFPAPPETMFAIWTRPEYVKIWFASSHGFDVETCDIDLRPGGEWRVTTRRRDVVEHPWGVFHTVEPNRRIVHSELYEGTDFHSTLSVDFEAIETGCRVHLCESGFPDTTTCEEHVKGWSFVMHFLEQALLSPVAAVEPELHGRISAERPASSLEQDLKAARERAEAEGRLVQPR